MTRVCHLIDDCSPGGVTRFLDYMRSSKALSELADHTIVPVKAGLSRPPKVDADIIVSHVVLSWKNLPFFVALRARHPAIPFIHMEHSYSPAFEQIHVTSPKRFRAMLGVSLALFDRIISISSAQRNWLTDEVRVPNEKVALLPPCVDLGGFLGLPDTDGKIRSIGAFGRFDEQKGFDILIPAFLQANLDDVTLHLFGDGPMRSELETLAEGDPRVVFHGFIDDPARAMAAVDAIAMPSRREPYGLVALEALAAGRALLVSRIDGLIDHALNGAYPVQRLTVDDWADAIRALPTSNDVQRRTYARRLAARAEPNCAEGWRTLIAQLAG